MGRCLLALAPPGGGTPSDLGYEVIVADNGSEDGTTAMVRSRFPWVRLIELGRNLGFSKATNRAAAVAGGEVFILLNPDTEMNYESVEALRRSVLGNRGGIVGARQVDQRDALQLSVGGSPGFWHEAARHLLQRGFDRDVPLVRAGVDFWLRRFSFVPWVAASCLGVSSKVFRKVGGFDEVYFLYFEDIDFCLRVGRAGYPIRFDADITVLHHRGQIAAKHPGVAKEAYRQSRQRFWSTHGSRAMAWLMRFR